MATAIKDEDLTRELLELERRYWQAMKDGDVKAAAGLTDTPCIVAGPQGVGSIGAKDLEAMFASAAWKLLAFTLKDGAKARRIGADAAVLAYEAHEELTVDGRPVSLDVADCSTWVRRDGRWRCASHTETIEGDPFGRDRAAAAPPAFTARYAVEESDWGTD